MTNFSQAELPQLSPYSLALRRMAFVPAAGAVIGLLAGCGSSGSSQPKPEVSTVTSYVTPTPTVASEVPSSDVPSSVVAPSTPGTTAVPTPKTSTTEAAPDNCFKPHIARLVGSVLNQANRAEVAADMAVLKLAKTPGATVTGSDALQAAQVPKDMLRDPAMALVMNNARKNLITNPSLTKEQLTQQAFATDIKLPDCFNYDEPGQITAVTSSLAARLGFKGGAQLLLYVTNQLKALTHGN